MKYEIKTPLTLTGLADPKYQDLTFSERLKKDCRVIGGDKGDIEFQGYDLDVENGLTVLYKPILVTTLELNEDEAYDIACEIIQSCFDSIGLETVE